MCPYLTRGLLENEKIFYNHNYITRTSKDLFVECKEEKCAWWNPNMGECKYIGTRKK